MDHSQVLLADFQSIVDGKYEEMSTSELSGGARIHYIFQAIFVRSLEVSLQNGQMHFSHFRLFALASFECNMRPWPSKGRLFTLGWRG